MKEKNKITNYKNIAIINTAFIGDVVLSFYLAEVIKQNHRGARIIFVTASRLKDLVESIESIDFFVAFDKNLDHKGLKGIIKIAENLRFEKVDLILAPHRSSRTSLLAFLVNPKFSVSYSTSSFKFLYSKTVKYFFNKHEVERNLELLSIFEDVNIPEKLPKVKIQFPESVVVKFESFFGNFSKNEARYIVSVAPGSVWGTKRWKEDGFIELCRYLYDEGWLPVLLGSTEDFEICNRISSNSNVLNLAGKTTLLETTFLIRKSALLVTNDSAPTHLATLVGTPCLTIFGPTIPEFGFYPLSTNSAIIEVDEICRPCSIHGYQSCPLRHHKCMDRISTDMVFDKAKQLLGCVK
ncbi:MAG: glycosyltransferase family 9 protein [Ignavibacteria bacterium]|nr:glycosyltransferase family 9 protein [Ignavibacteria bacterium]